MDTSSVPPKRCTQCGQEYPATPEYFTRTKSTRDGLHTKCKSCKQTNNRKWWSENTEEINRRRRESYPKHQQRNIEYHRKWRQKNRDRILQQKKDVYWANREADLARSKAWRQANPEYRQQYDKKYAQENRGRIRRYKLRWANENRDRINSRRRGSRVDQQIRETRKRGLPDSFTKEDWSIALEYFHGCCAVCGRQLHDLFGTHKAAMDHWIPLSSPDCPGTIPANIVPLCHGIEGCNNSKHNRRPESWLAERYGKHKAAEILDRIETYFQSLKE